MGGGPQPGQSPGLAGGGACQAQTEDRDRWLLLGQTREAYCSLMWPRTHIIPSFVPSTSWLLLKQQPYVVGVIIIPILQMHKLRFREALSLAHAT